MSGKPKETLQVKLPEISFSFGSYNESRGLITLDNLKNPDRPTELVVYPEELIQLERICASLHKYWVDKGVLL